MGLLEFNKLPINTLVGADWKTFNAITKGREIDAAYKGKFRLTKAVCRMLSTLAPLQDKCYEKLLADKPLEHDPVFILGHWRSGTTFVHNVFSCDKHFGYNTTYQTVFPHLMMWGQPFFKKNMSWLLSYFRTEATARRKWSRPYWTRTPTSGGWTPSKAAYVTADGALKGNSAKSSYSYRPILVLPQEVLVDESGNVIG